MRKARIAFGNGGILGVIISWVCVYLTEQPTYILMVGLAFLAGLWSYEDNSLYHCTEKEIQFCSRNLEIPSIRRPLLAFALGLALAIFTWVDPNLWIFTTHVQLYVLWAAWQYPLKRKIVRLPIIVGLLSAVPFIFPVFIVFPFAVLITVFLVLPLEMLVRKENSSLIGGEPTDSLFHKKERI